MVEICRRRATPRQPATTPSSGTSASNLRLLGHVYAQHECCRAQCTPLALWGDGGGENRAPQPVPRAWGGAWLGALPPRLLEALHELWWSGAASEAH